MQEIGKISLKNNGGFVVRLEFEHYNDATGKWIRTGGTGDITVGFSKTASPGEHGVPDGCMVRLHVNVIWGSDKTSTEMFIYKSGSNNVAGYAISGTTLNNHLEFRGVSSANLFAGPMDGDSDSISLEQANALFDYSGISDEQMDEVKANLESSPLAQSGSYGPISWDVGFHLDPKDITKSSVDVKISVLSFNIINAHLDAQNPKATADLSVGGIGVVAELGVDFSKRLVYLRGTLDFDAYKKKFDLTILKF